MVVWSETLTWRTNVIDHCENRACSSGDERYRIAALGQRRDREEHRILVASSDAQLRLLVRAVFHLFNVEVQEASSAESAIRKIRQNPIDVVVVDGGLPGVDPLSLCRRLRMEEQIGRALGIVLLEANRESVGWIGLGIGADATASKPIDPFQFLGVVESIVEGSIYDGPAREQAEQPLDEQLLLHVHDSQRLLELVRAENSLLLDTSGEETAAALARALESKDSDTGAHARRVQRYAVELTEAIDAPLLEDPSLRFGFLLHDVGKIGIPDRILRKRGPLTPAERRCMETHAVVGEQMLCAAPSLQEEGLRVVRHHHERWDGGGYPDGLSGEQIPLSARIFAVVDTLDAITCDRSYRAARSWKEAMEVISFEAGRQFDPCVVEAAKQRQLGLRRISYELRGETRRVA